ncbi:MAG: phosphate-starvation-inducible PsiE family protein [Thermomicrobium sp.]
MHEKDRPHVPHTEIHHLSRRFLEAAQDVLVVALVLVLFGLMVRTLIILLQHLFGPGLDFRIVIAEVLFMLVMVELMRLLVVYLEEHRVAVDFMVELGIVATLREVVLRGVVELGWAQLLAISVFLLTLGALLRFGTLRVQIPLGRMHPAERERALETHGYRDRSARTDALTVSASPQEQRSQR